MHGMAARGQPLVMAESHGAHAAETWRWQQDALAQGEPMMIRVAAPTINAQGAGWFTFGRLMLWATRRAR